MGLDLTQAHLDQLFKESAILRDDVHEIHTCVDEMKPELAVVKSQTSDLRNEIRNGLSARLRRTELMMVSIVAILAADKGPSIIGQVVGLIR